MLDLVIRAAARDDLRAILAYGIARHGRERAERYLRAIDQVILRLTAYPAMGALHPDIKGMLHSLPSGTHRIYYQTSATHVILVRVLHQAMDVSRQLD